jgi:UDP-N-acetylglucosamine--N-acetylmuramyl-(pentapeptide) pyrophosphoryl-undecaprenol N-acetylglucosamine transferase
MPGASGDEQTANARLVTRAGGGAILPQAELTPPVLLAQVRQLLADAADLKNRGERARTLAIPDAADRLVDLLLEICE